MDYYGYYPEPVYYDGMHPPEGYEYDMRNYEDGRFNPFLGSLATGLAGGLIGGLLVPGLYGYPYPYPYPYYGGYPFGYGGYYGGYGYGPW
ncbi:hypothetical protein [Thalassobacillus pellis]|uniref:hypothetical protein n=1 Tax=Thalassobacillus pellis TaxID=748008 RepID=UPI001960483D|nr:hypothetical protein [Thalassobacillus pellis]MBM7553791.1 hypothetical protein [Thalassobacillus pellis]